MIGILETCECGREFLRGIYPQKKCEACDAMSHTETMPWDKDDDEFEREYKELYPEKERRFTFTEFRNKYLRGKDGNKNKA